MFRGERFPEPRAAREDMRRTTRADSTGYSVTFPATCRMALAVPMYFIIELNVSY